MTDLVFLDTETCGLHLDAPIWEFAGVRRSDGGETHVEFLIDHDPADWLDTLPERFLADYRNRYQQAGARPEHEAAERIHQFTDGAIVIGCNPGFDLERLALLLRRNGIEPSWHYHPLDMPSVCLGFLAALGIKLPPPADWKSDRLALAAAGVDSADYARHTAMGDVQWVAAQWDVLMDMVTGCTS